MPMHDWTRVDAGIYHAFHHEWISEISRALNRGLLPDDFYALPEQQAAEFGPDMPLFIQPDAHILVPLERTYCAAWDALPKRWQRVLGIG